MEPRTIQFRPSAVAKQLALRALCADADESTSKLAAKDATFKEVMILALPMSFDLTATLLMSIGLL